MDRISSRSRQPFVVSPAESEFCRQNEIPLPQLAPEERLRDMLVFRNRLYLYNGKCALTGKPGLTSIPLHQPFVSYDVDVWESDKWDAFDYGRPYDFNRGFFDQFQELLHVTPLPNLAVIRSTMENSDYTNGVTGAKNCYLAIAISYCEDSMFSFLLNECTDVVDCVVANKCELCFDCRNIVGCYDLRYCSDCINCSESQFLSNCQGCRNCFGCVNLSQRQYCYFNEQLSKEEYNKKLAGMQLGSHAAVSKLKRQFAEFAGQFSDRQTFGKQNEGSSGDFLTQTKNCTNCFFVDQSEDNEWCLWVTKSRSSFFHATYGNESELIYNSVTCGDQAYDIKFSTECWPGTHHTEYSWYTGYGSAYCFGCVGLKKKSYCVLNKQYSKAEYEDLVARIKTQMRQDGSYGRFFPLNSTPHAYNNSDAALFFPKEREEAELLGYRWDPEQESPGGAAPSVIPDDISSVPDSIVNETLICSGTGKRFKIIRKELEFYRRHGLPLPRVAPLERMKLNSAFIGVKMPRSQPCTKCEKEMITARYGRGRALICDECYQAEVF